MASHGASKKMAMEHAPKESKEMPKELAHIKLTPAENGGVVAEHNFSHYEHPPEPHVFAAHEGKELAAHIGEHMGMKGMGAEAAEPQEEDEQD